MQIFSATALLAAGVLAQPSVVPRDATTITGLLESIHGSMANVDNHLEQYHGGPPIALHQAGSALIELLKDSTETANCMDPLTIKDVIAIAGISEQVTEIGSKFLNDLTDAAPLFAENGLCNLTHKFTVALGNVSNEFFAATKAKFPPETQEKATEEIAGSNALFAKAQAAYAPGACVNKAKHPGPGSGGKGNCTKVPAESASQTSAAWHTPTVHPHECGSGHHNGTWPGKPAIPIETGSAGVLATSGGLMAVAAVVAFML